VIMIVLISVIYPSRVAAAIAIPDATRAWTLPEPEGSEMKVTLPFLLKYSEQLGVGGYLREYYQGHQDVSHGIFTTDDISLEFYCPQEKYRASVVQPTARMTVFRSKLGCGLPLLTSE